MRTFYLVIDDDCMPALYPTGPGGITPELPVICPPCPPTRPIPPLPPTKPVPPIGTLPTATVTTNGSNLNIRSGPSMDAEILGRVPNGTQLTILEFGPEGWYRISYNGIMGYVSGQWITID